MTMQLLVAFEILIPVVSDVTRQPWPAGKMEAFEEQLVNLFGGFTWRGVVRGAWKDDAGIVVSDTSYCYLVSVPAGREEDVRQLARAACVEFEQRCIYLQRVGSAELVGPE